MKAPKGYISSVEFAVPEDLTATINIQKTGTTIDPFTVTVADGKGKLVVPLPYSATFEEADVVVSATFDVDGHSYTRNMPVEIYTPYLDLWEIRGILGDDATDDECWSVEAAVRNVINAHTGQSFGYAHKTVTLVADAGTALPLPEHTVSIETLYEGTQARYDINQDIGSSFLGDGRFIITGSGWFLKQSQWAEDTLFDYSYSTSDPIVAPSIRRQGQYRNDSKYTITGYFGYETVPEEVQEAAKLLINDYACAEQIYRDRFLSSMKAADWTLVYNSGAYYRTGNARANLLLSPWVVNRMKVI